MTKQSINGPLKVTGVFESPSKYGGEIYDIKMEDEKGDELRSYVDPQNHNFKNWTKIIDSVLKHNKIITIDGNIFYKKEKGEFSLHRRTKRPLVDADSRPEIIKEEDNIDAQEYARRQLQFKIEKLNLLNELGKKLDFGFCNGRWEPEVNIHRALGEPDYIIKKEDDIDTIRAKATLRSTLQYALDLNQGFHQ